MAAKSAKKSPLGLNWKFTFPLKLINATPIIAITNPMMKFGVMCFSFKKNCAVMATKIGLIETMTLTFEADVYIMAMFSIS